MIITSINMHHFHFKGDNLYCEDCRVSDIAERVGTPVYVYSHKTLTDHFLKLKKAFRSVNPLISYSMKANANLAFVKSLVDCGAGLDIVSGGELYRAKKLRCDPKKIVYAGVGKTVREIKEAIQWGILLFNAESLAELEVIDRTARSLGRKVDVSLRVNPDVDVKTHKYVTTGKKGTKFGLDFCTARVIFARQRDFPNLRLNGVHVHIGSQILTYSPFVRAFRRLLDFVRLLERDGHKIRFIDLGGGLGIIYGKERPQTAREFARRVLPLLRRFKSARYRIIFEPGRFIAGNSGIFVTKVIYVKKANAKNFVIVDGGMNDLVRPALYGSYHEVVPLRRTRGRKILADVVGPVCESGDFFALDRMLIEPKAGDYISFFGAGAYGFSMSSNYNARPRAAEVMVKGKSFEIVRRRESYNDLVRGERIPGFLKKK
ncbi:MAG: diaminopimelate decarboxylase [Candidatus Omnitrophica bacterium]|nr:diaminopimelate decarboxylase [Candidatus Omnitrophota bacterium]